LANDFKLKLLKHTSTFLNDGVLLQVVYKKKRMKKKTKTNTLPCGKGQGKPKQE
jgi:hypothetical protein